VGLEVAVGKRSNGTTLRGRRRAAGRGGLLAATVVLAATAISLPAPAGSAPAPAKFLGPVLSRVENATTTLTRDGGFSAGLPGGKDFWVFADTPRYEFKKNRWKVTAVVPGSTAGMAPFTPGKILRSALTEVRPGAALKPTRQPTRFMAAPVAYMPDGSGKRCVTAKGGPNAFSVRWPTGAALMPDKKNILVPYAIVCVFNVRNFILQGWGFALFNYKKQQFTVQPTDVIRAQPSGTTLPTSEMYGSPVIVGNNVTFYSWGAGPSDFVYATTVPATAAALRSRASYVPQPLAGVPWTYMLHVGPRSKTHSTFTMFHLGGSQGQYTIYAASSPTGPWLPVASGVLPRCDTKGCNSFALHPELSPAGRLVVSYYVAGYGPGVATKHPYPHEPLSHVVMAAIPCNC
jgi:hypothetical protein